MNVNVKRIVIAFTINAVLSLSGTFEDYIVVTHSSWQSFLLHICMFLQLYQRLVTTFAMP